MSGEQEYHICLYRFSFSLHIKSRLVKENRNYYKEQRNIAAQREKGEICLN